MKKGDWVQTPRFCRVPIEEVFESEKEARRAGYTEPTYTMGEWKVLGKCTGINQMEFAAYRD